MRDFVVAFVAIVVVAYIAILAIPRVTRRSQSLLIILAGIGGYRILHRLIEALLS